MNVDMERVKAPSQAQYAYCSQCDEWLGCQFWSLSKSVYLHRQGTGHKPTLFRLVAANPKP